MLGFLFSKKENSCGNLFPVSVFVRSDVSGNDISSENRIVHFPLGDQTMAAQTEASRELDLFAERIILIATNDLRHILTARVTV